MSAQPQWKYDIIPSPPDPKDSLYKLMPPPDYGVLPPRNRLNVFAPIRSQAKQGSCWGFAGTRAFQIGLLLKGISVILSPAFLYWKTREAMNPADETQDTGSDLRTGLDVMLKVGVCPEELMPYSEFDFSTPPSQAALEAAAQYRIQAYHRLDDLDAIKYANTQQLPIIFGFPVYQEMESSPDGHFSMPGPGEQPLGGHAIDCDGYDDAINAFFDPNSWGVDHGDGGVYYLPYGTTTLPWWEAWAITV